MKPSVNPAVVASDQSAVFDFLSNPRTHGSRDPVKRIDTHAAVVFLAGANAYKVKKAVRFPFLDQSTLELRRGACQAEVAINRHFTPDLYLGVVPITRENGRLSLGGGGLPVEWAVHLRRFNETKTLDLVAERGEITTAMIRQVASLILDSHQAAVVGDGVAATEALQGVVEESLTELLEAPEIFPRKDAEELASALRLAFGSIRDLLIDRGNTSRVRRCHGDLHLRNIVLLDRGPALFDAIEFSDSIATTDIFYDLAFALMDLWERGLKSEANLLLNCYLSGCPDIGKDLTGLGALPFFISLRATVIAKVAAIRFRDVDHAAATRAEALQYFRCARELLHPVSPVLVAVGGLSGSGKTMVATGVAPFVGRAPGGIHLRSDIERKRLFRRGQLERLPPRAYSGEVTSLVYANLRAMAETALRAGQAVVVDAVHATARQRELIWDVSHRAGVPFVGIWLDAPRNVRLDRVALRAEDASDATAEVVRSQVNDPIEQPEWRVLDAVHLPQAVVAEARAYIEMETRPES